MRKYVTLVNQVNALFKRFLHMIAMGRHPENERPVDCRRVRVDLLEAELIALGHLQLAQLLHDRLLPFGVSDARKRFGIPIKLGLELHATITATVGIVEREVDFKLVSVADLNDLLIEGRLFHNKDEYVTLVNQCNTLSVRKSCSIMWPLEGVIGSALPSSTSASIRISEAVTLMILGSVFIDLTDLSERFVGKLMLVEALGRLQLHTGTDQIFNDLANST